MKNYYEIVFEGHYNEIKGFLEGYKLGSKKPWQYFISENNNIQTETFAEILVEWISLKHKIHHIIIEEDFYKSIEEKLSEESPLSSIKKNHLRSIKKVKDTSFTFECLTFGKKYGLEVQEILKNIPNTLKLNNYEKEENDLTGKENHKDLDLYAPEHDYMFKCNGEIAGSIENLLDFHKKLKDHPLVNVKNIKLNF